jgi:hypothetical protein
MKDYFARESELGDIDPPERLYKLVIAPATRHEILNELHRMNIHYGTFFPGLDGFARSLSTTLTISEGPFFGDEEVDYRI